MKAITIIGICMLMLLVGCNDIYCSDECYKCRNLCFQDICSPDDVDDWKECWRLPDSQDYCYEECIELCNNKCTYGTINMNETE